MEVHANKAMCPLLASKLQVAASMSEDVATTSANEEAADAGKTDQGSKRKACQLNDEVVAPMSEDVATTSVNEEAADADNTDQGSKKKACLLTDEPGAGSLVALQRWFSVAGHLHLGLGLRLGAVYSEEDLRGRCQGQQQKLSKLEQYFADSKILKEVPAPPTKVAKAAKSRRGEIAAGEKREQAVVRSASKHDSQAARKRHIGFRNCIVVGQIVWHCDISPRRTARVVAIATEREKPYLIRYIDSDPQNPVEEDFFVSDVKPLLLDEVLKVLPSSTSSSPSAGSAGPAAVRPVPRVTEPSLLGEGSVAWVCGDNRPPWPVKLQSLISPEGELQVWRVKSLGSGDTDEEEVPASQLLPFASGDARALADVAEEAELAHATRAAQ